MTAAPAQGVPWESRTRPLIVPGFLAQAMIRIKIGNTIIKAFLKVVIEILPGDFKEIVGRV
jgi:hypothetical protein